MRHVRPLWSARPVLALLAVITSFAAPGALSAQDRPLVNLQHFSPEIGRDSLIQVMRGFSFALGVRCQYCHVGGDGSSFEGVEFESDDDPDKRKARYMLRMVETLNRSMLPLMADRDEPSAEMSCKTCHRGRPKPALLTEVLRSTLDESGADSAQATYRSLRESTAMSGMYDFGEWEMNVLAERLEREGRERDAIAIYEVNRESHPNSLSIELSLGGLYEVVEDLDSAISAYERALALAPGNQRAEARLAALRGGDA